MITAGEMIEFLDYSFGWGQQFLTQITKYGFKEQHIIFMLKFCKILQEVISTLEMKNMESINLVKRVLEQTAVYLLKA